jgi:CDP-glycerol glycerophosphotransferase
MPTVSCVLVVHSEQAYVRPCVESILGQDLADVELVAIDDAATGHAPAVLDALAAADPRVTVHHAERRLGRGGARDLGLELARGDYVWLVEATDTVAPGALAAVAETLAQLAPDVLLLHHARVDMFRATRHGPHRRLLANLGAVTLEQRPALGAAAPNAWDKVLRRAHVRDLRFGPGAHDELTVTWPALLRAARIGALDAPAYVRYEPPNREPAGSPFDVFAQYEAVLELAGDRRALVAPHMLRHLLALLPQIPEGQRREFFARISRAYPRGVPVTGGRVNQARARLVERDAYAAFSALEESVAARRAIERRRAAASRRRGRLEAQARAVKLRTEYRARRRRPLDPDLALFAAYWYSAYACNPRAIYEKARELVPGMRGVWVVNRGAADKVPAGVEYVVAGTADYYDALARATYLVNNVNWPNYFVKRPGSVHVMTHHGTPLKRMGLDEQLSPVTKMEFGSYMRRVARWDYSVSANPHTTLVWERVYPFRYETLETGYPRNDRLANATEDEARRLRDGFGIAPHQTAVLYAPTHRDWQVGYQPVLDVEALAEALGPDFVVLDRTHYFYAGRPGRLARDVTDHPSVEDLCIAADVLLTDYSSIMFDYGVLDRPILIHAPDWELYRAMRGVYFDLLAEPPGVVARTAAEVADALRSGADDPAARATFRERFCSLEDGQAAERVVERVWGSKYSGAGAADQRRRPDLQRRGLPR